MPRASGRRGAGPWVRVVTDLCDLYQSAADWDLRSLGLTILPIDVGDIDHPISNVLSEIGWLKVGGNQDHGWERGPWIPATRPAALRGDLTIMTCTNNLHFAVQSSHSNTLAPAECCTCREARRNAASCFSGGARFLPRPGCHILRFGFCRFAGDEQCPVEYKRG